METKKLMVEKQEYKDTRGVENGGGQQEWKRKERGAEDRRKAEKSSLVKTSGKHLGIQSTMLMQPLQLHTRTPTPQYTRYTAYTLIYIL